jgi:iron complex transport system substrate-binding protein
MPLCFRRVLRFGAVMGSVSDLLGLRLSLPLQSRPAQISDGTHDSSERLGLCEGNMATIFCGSHSRKRSRAMKRGGVLLGMILLVAACDKPVRERSAGLPTPPLNMEALNKALSYARGETPNEQGWPRTIHYTYRVYDFRTDTFQEEERAFEIKQRPVRIVPHAVGVAEILWAICPRERLIAFNDLSADPELCVLAEEIRKRDRIFKTKQTELIIAYEPDLVFTVFYSGAEFKKKLKQAKIPYFDLGYFGTIESIRSQILLLGRIIGEEGNAEALVEVMDAKIRQLKSKIPRGRSGVRVLYYDEGGYVPGKSTNFNSICEIIRAVNVGAEQGVKSWSQIDYETLLKWDPDIILVPEGSGLNEQARSNQMLAQARAVREGKVFPVPGIYLRATSQYMVLSANYFAGVVYEGGF